MLKNLWNKTYWLLQDKMQFTPKTLALLILEIISHSVISPCSLSITLNKDGSMKYKKTLLVWEIARKLRGNLLASLMIFMLHLKKKTLNDDMKE